MDTAKIVIFGSIANIQKHTNIRGNAVNFDAVKVLKILEGPGEHSQHDLDKSNENVERNLEAIF